MADIVELHIKIDQLKEAERGFETLKNQMSALNREKVRIQIDRDDIQRWKHDLEEAIKAAEKDGDKVRVANLKKELDDVTALGKRISDEFNAIKRQIDLLSPSVAAAREEASRLSREVKEQEDGLTRLSKEAEKIAREEEKQAEAAAKAEEKERQQAEAAAKAAEEEARQAEAARQAAAEKARQEELAERVARREADAAAEAERLAQQAEAAQNRFEGVLGVIDGIANGLSMASSIVGGIGDFASGIFGAFEAASSIFSFDVMSKAMDTLVSQFAQNLTGNMDRIASRYDIMSTFGQYMSLMGVSDEDAKNSLARINESILGLPIGLDEAAYRLRRYQMFIGNIDEATNFTIGIQRSILAGGASEQMRNLAYNQIERLLTTGKLSTARQWMSLLNGLGVSVQFIAEELGDADMSGKELAAALYSGKISSFDFLQAITALGEGTSDAAQRMNAALDIYKGTLESWRSNIEFSFIRGGQQSLAAFNTTIQATADVSIIGFMESAKHAIDDAFKEVQDWIYMNPDSFKINFDALGDLADSLSSFDIGEIASQSLQYTADFIESVTSAVNRIDKGKASTFISFAISIAGPLAKIASLSGRLGVVDGVIERFKDFNWTDTFNKIMDNVNDISDVTNSLLRLIPNSTMEDLIAFGLTWAPLIASGLSMIAGAINAVGSAIRNGRAIKDVLTTLSAGFFGPGGGAAALGIGAVTAAIGLLVWEILDFNTRRMNAREVLALDEVEKGTTELNNLSASISNLLDKYDSSIASADLHGERAMELLSEIDELNQTFMEGGDSAIRSKLQNTVDYFNSMFPELALAVDKSTGALDNNSRSVIDNSQAFVSAMANMRKADYTKTMLSNLDEERIALEVALDRNQNLYWDKMADYLGVTRGSLRYSSGVFTQNVELGQYSAELRKWMNQGAESSEAYSRLAADLAKFNRGNLATNEEIWESFTDLFTKHGNAVFEVLNRDQWAMITEAEPELQQLWDAIEQGYASLEQINEEYGVTSDLLNEYTGAVDAAKEAGIRFANAEDSQSASIDGVNGSLRDQIGLFQNLTQTVTEYIDKMLSAFDAMDEIAAKTSAEAAGIIGGNVTEMNKVINAAHGIADYITLNNAPEYMRSYLNYMLEYALENEDFGWLVGAWADIQANDIASLEDAAKKFGEWETAKEELILSVSDAQFAAQSEAQDVLYTYAEHPEEFSTKRQEWISKVAHALASAQKEAIREAGEEIHGSTFLGKEEQPVFDIFDYVGSSYDQPYFSIDSQKKRARDWLERQLHRIKSPEPLAVLAEQEPLFGGEYDAVAEAAENAARIHKAVMEDIGLWEQASEENPIVAIDMEAMMGSIMPLKDEAIPGLTEVIAGEEGSLAAAIQTVDTLSNGIITDTTPEQIDNLDMFSGVLSSFVDEGLEPVRAKTEEVKTETNNLETALSALATTVQGTNGDMQVFTGTLQAVSDLMITASASAILLADAINSIPDSKTITIGVDSQDAHDYFEAPGVIPFLDNSEAKQLASGGMVSGTYIGRDNVPAMLMPGEFVVRRRASQALGRAFLENINRLNIPGAMDALMKQAIPMPGHFVAYNNSRSYDNHAQVIQNINTNNAAFTYRRASRFVGAL